MRGKTDGVPYSRSAWHMSLWCGKPSAEPHLHSLQPHLHGTSSAELCLPAQPFPHGFPTALGHSNTNESAIFNSLESLTTAAGFCYHFISIYWMEEKIAQFWNTRWNERGKKKERVRKYLWNIGYSTFTCVMAGSTFNGLMCSFEAKCSNTCIMHSIGKTWASKVKS